MGSSINQQKKINMKYTTVLLVCGLARQSMAFTLPEAQAKSILKFSKPLPQVANGDYTLEKRDNWWESNFKPSSQERECAEEHCFLEEYIESKENELSEIDLRRMVDGKSQWFDRRVEAYFQYYYVNCLQFTVTRDEVKNCLDIFDDVLTDKVFSNPRLPGGDEMAIVLAPSNINIEPVNPREFTKSTEGPTVEVTTNGSVENESSPSEADLVKMISEFDKTSSTQQVLDTTPVVVTDSKSIKDIDRKIRNGVNFDTEASTDQSTTTLETLVDDTTTHTYDIVTFGINPDGSIFYNEVEKSESPTKNSDLEKMISAFEQKPNTDKSGSIEHIFN